MRKSEVGDAPANGLLAALPGASRERLFAKTQLVSLSVKDILYHPGGPITSVYFPLTCVISMMTEMKNGATIEIATVGNEGVLGIPVFLGIDVAVALGITQVSGEARRMSAEDFKQAAKSDEYLRHNPASLHARSSHANRSFRGVQQLTFSGRAICPMAAHDAWPNECGCVCLHAGVPIENVRREPCQSEHCHGSARKSRPDQAQSQPDHRTRLEGT